MHGLLAPKKKKKKTRAQGKLDIRQFPDEFNHQLLYFVISTLLRACKTYLLSAEVTDHQHLQRKTLGSLWTNYIWQAALML